jgi:RHS repeat-associated protein
LLLRTVRDTHNVWHSAANANTLQYTGRDNDGTGLQYNRARYYSPSLGRFISEDPIGFAGGDVNLYAYVGNSPTNYVDPNGTNPLIAACALGALGNVATDWFIAGLSGRKYTLEDAGKSALTGCVFGLIPGAGITDDLLQHSDDLALQAGKHFDVDQNALIQLVKELQRKGKISGDDTKTLLDWAKGYGLRHRGPEVHPDRPFGKYPHIHIGPLDHIWVD